MALFISRYESEWVSHSARIQKVMNIGSSLDSLSIADNFQLLTEITTEWALQHCPSTLLQSTRRPQGINVNTAHAPCRAIGHINFTM